MRMDVYRQKCMGCENDFYESEHDELDTCPTCKQSLVDLSPALQSEHQVEIAVDPITGKITVS